VRDGDGHERIMSEEAELAAEARRSQEKTQELREESGLGAEQEPEAPEPPEDPLPDAPRGEPWAKTSSGDADSVTDDD
jgi:hypothetical protein